MKKEPLKLHVPTMTDDEVELSVNYSPYADDYVRLTVNGKDMTIPKWSFQRIAFIIANTEEEQEATLPVKKMMRRTFRKHVILKMNKPMAAGEYLKTAVDFTVELPEGSKPVGNMTQGL